MNQKRSIVSNQCPRCHQGAIYSGFFQMNKLCPYCGYRYETEEGFFIGAMFLNCIFLPVSALPVILIFAYNDRIALGGVLGVAQIILLSPFVARYSKLLWLHLCYRIAHGNVKT